MKQNFCNVLVCLASTAIVAACSSIGLADAEELSSVIAGRDWRSVEVDQALLMRVERATRRWLKIVANLQQGGGWRLKHEAPWPDAPRRQRPVSGASGFTIVDNRKAYSVSRTAMQFIYAYETFGDERYLNVAKQTAELYLRSQGPDGWWMHTIFVDREGQPVIPQEHRDGWLKHHIMIQDHVQTGVIVFLVYMHRITNDKRYLAAAVKGADFLLLSQNPNGSWSHHWNAIARRGETDTGLEHGGELNDQATTEALRTLLLMYHVTGDKKYLPPIRRGGNWIVAAQMKGPTFGWAAQYDKDNNPIWARTFEPPAVDDGNGNEFALRGLRFMYQLTADKKYLDAGDRCIAWLKRAIEADKDGILWSYYDPKTGRPIMPSNDRRREVYFLDTNLKMREKAKTLYSGQGGPRSLKGTAKFRQARFESARRETPRCLLEIKPGRPSKGQRIDRLKSELPKIREALKRHEQRLSARSGLWPVFGGGEIYTLLNCLRNARAGIGEIPLGGMKSEIRDPAHADDHAWPVTNRYDTPLRPN